jgi:microcystin-dependent protein
MDAFVGTILLLPYGFTPVGWEICDGRKLSINQNQALYSLLGTKFGGDPGSNFALPDLRGKAPAPNMAYYIALNGIYPDRG